MDLADAALLEQKRVRASEASSRALYTLTILLSFYLFSYHHFTLKQAKPSFPINPP